ncbi:MAG TPA: HAD-IA family hydrolase, partial [Prosthecobacter sp.]
MTREPPYKLAAFDFDGTLADTMPWFFSTLDALADRHRFRHVSAAEAETLRHQTSREVVQALGISRWRIPFIARDFSRRMAKAAAADTFTLFPGVADLLAALTSAGIAVAIVSSNRETTIRHILGPSAAHVTHFACSAALFGKARKFQKLIRQTGLPLKSILSIGDELRDIEAARSVGISTAAVTWGYARESALRAAGPDGVFQSVEELRNALIR